MSRRPHPDLPQRQRDTLEFIAGYIADHGYAPTVNEICDGIGVSSTNGVSDHIRALERKGYLVKGPKGQARSLKLTTPTGDAETASLVRLVLRHRKHPDLLPFLRRLDGAEAP